MCTNNNNNNGPTLQLIADLCYNKFKTISKKSKPTDSEWTVLAGIVQYDARSKSSQLISLATGTKCIGHSKLCAKGFILNDSHAEVLARRGFLRYLHFHLRKAAKGKNSDEEDGIFSWQSAESRFMLNEHLEFHFFSTQTPCGDACISSETKGCETSHQTAKRQRLDDDNDDIFEQGLPLSLSPTVYTGAKLISDKRELALDNMLQTPAALRTKPGRGERTLSMSCSDKLSRWNVLGVQGALLDMLINKPIYFKTLNFCCKNARVDCLQRAIYQRWHASSFHHERYQLQKPLIRVDATQTFQYAQCTNKQPSPNSIIWVQLPETLGPYEIAVNGKRQGVTKKKLDTPQAALEVSKYKMLLSFISSLECCGELCEKLQKSHQQRFNLNNITYAFCKAMSTDYQIAWQHLKRDLFQQWTSKPQYLIDFTAQKY